MATRRSTTGWMIVAMVLGQLAIIWIKDLREHGASHEFLGYAPNLVAAATLPNMFVALLLKRGFDASAPYAWSQLWREDAVILKSLLITVGGLLAWEFMQVYRPNRTFDTQDVWATLAGAASWLAGALACRALTVPSHRRLLAANPPSVAESASP
jgi:hypothetical protein